MRLDLHAMVCALLRPWLVAMAAAVVLLATPRAFAADQCVAELASLAPPEGDDPIVEPIVIEGEAVPISLSVGASAVAPRTVHAVGDAFIAAERTCESAFAERDGWVSHDDQRDRSGPEPAIDAFLAPGEPLSTVAEPMIVSSLRPAQAPRQGVVRAIERPPRR